MNPNIDGSEFGSITIAGRRIENGERKGPGSDFTNQSPAPPG
jgi:hypothetical protein